MKQKIIHVVLLFLLLDISANISAQERYVRPVDEGKTDASFSNFREKLIEAVKKHDKKHLLSVLDPNIKASFGGDDGIEDFKKMWKINSPKSELWDELFSVLSNGGTFIKEGKNNLFCAPYSFTAFPDDLDAFENQVIFGSNVNLRAQPDLSAKVDTQLSFNVVKVDYENSVSKKNNKDKYLWLKVKTLGGKEGYVSAEFVRSPIDYRACFEKKNGQWKMTVFVAGD
ncbi:MAG: SH3 domain-containing protein [Pyrinomonadaceae bacterium]